MTYCRIGSSIQFVQRRCSTAQSVNHANSKSTCGIPTRMPCGTPALGRILHHARTLDSSSPFRQIPVTYQCAFGRVRCPVLDVPERSIQQGERTNAESRYCRSMRDPVTLRSPSILLRQQDARRRAIGFGDDPDLHAFSGLVNGEDPAPINKSLFVGLSILFITFAPISSTMTNEEFHGVLARFRQCRESTRSGDELTERKSGCCSRYRKLDSNLFQNRSSHSSGKPQMTVRLKKTVAGFEHITHKRSLTLTARCRLHGGVGTRAESTAYIRWRSSCW